MEQLRTRPTSDHLEGSLVLTDDVRLNLAALRNGPSENRLPRRLSFNVSRRDFALLQFLSNSMCQ